MTIRPIGLFTPQNIPFDPQRDAMRHGCGTMVGIARPPAEGPPSGQILGNATPMNIRYVDMQGNEYRGDARAVFQNAVIHQ